VGYIEQAKAIAVASEVIQSVDDILSASAQGALGRLTDDLNVLIKSQNPSVGVKLLPNLTVDPTQGLDSGAPAVHSSIVLRLL
jgi:hypothetical protein